jgi:hypothetical protein
MCRCFSKSLFPHRSPSPFDQQHRPSPSFSSQNASIHSQGVSNFLNLYNAALILRLVCTWFPSIPQNSECKKVDKHSVLFSPYLPLQF